MKRSYGYRRRKNIIKEKSRELYQKAYQYVLHYTIFTEGELSEQPLIMKK